MTLPVLVQGSHTSSPPIPMPLGAFLYPPYTALPLSVKNYSPPDIETSSIQTDRALFLCHTMPAT